MNVPNRELIMNRLCRASFTAPFSTGHGCAANPAATYDPRLEAGTVCGVVAVVW